MEDMGLKRFFKGKKVLLTGHTGFKGAWLSLWLDMMGAKVTGFSLKDYVNDEFYESLGLSERMNDLRGDIRDYGSLNDAISSAEPELVFHMAAQSIVKKSYSDPLYTIESNVLGTANVLESIRSNDCVKSSVIVTSDKCYHNNEWVWGYRENDPMGGFDTYSASKGCKELLVESYRKSFFEGRGTHVASARAGNVIGGGDWAPDRLIPDCMRALLNNETIKVRNPHSTRPWQHVLEPLSGYLMLAKMMFESGEYAESWNFGPDLESIKPVWEVVDMVLDRWGSGEWTEAGGGSGEHEAKSLSLDISKAWFKLGWRPCLDMPAAMDLTVEWYRRYGEEDVYQLSTGQIREYLKIRENS
ncbi:MAG: CDP-glucose 4,6-dehydratase [Candidatus Altiarchaeales archaeon]|nr:CDP-glucose 4,6-dehydratase [Candidatus Altiarchaeales archaeon]MBD3415644.1 CDP-glucose 4,6-dehydratase [Candidatus Altiarchaeales archaeon]